MPKTLKTTLFLFALMAAIAMAAFINHNIQISLPRTPLPTIESEVVYVVNLVPADAPYLGKSGALEGVQQDYRIHLKADKTYMFEVAVGWLGVEVSLYNEGRLLGDTSCGYNARCKFFAQLPQDGWGTIRISRGVGEKPESFSLEVRRVKNAFYRGKQSDRISILQAAPMPIIDFDVVYDGNMAASDAPAFFNGGGNIQDFRVRLKAGQTVLAQAKSTEFDILVDIYGEDRRLGFDAANDITPQACAQAKAPKDGLYTLRVTAIDLAKSQTGSFTLEVSKPLSDEQICKPTLRKRHSKNVATITPRDMTEAQ
ncbi:hypothetical protein [Pseudomonas sp. 18173]|uniref:hypothetical protein n=1 Tax=Pseudomonas sp. 18173 TaxID=3390055 RepID=UPI003D2376C3